MNDYWEYSGMALLSACAIPCWKKILHKVGLDPGLHNGQMKKWMPEKIALVYGIFLISDLNEWMCVCLFDKFACP